MTKSPRRRVGAALAKARRKAGLSQGRLADRLNRTQACISRMESGERMVEVREFIWIVRRCGEDPLPLLVALCCHDDFDDLYRPTKPKPAPAPRYEIEPYDPADEEPDDDEPELGHLKFDQGGAG